MQLCSKYNRFREVTFSRKVRNVGLRTCETNIHFSKHDSRSMIAAKTLVSHAQAKTFSFSHPLL